jgi:hypothetical protein
LVDEIEEFLDRCSQGRRGRGPDHDHPLCRLRGRDRAPSPVGPREWSVSPTTTTPWFALRSPATEGMR